MSDEREKTATAKVINLLLKREDTLLREWHPTLNDSLTPETVTYGSHYKVWWTCGEGDGCELGGKKKTGCPVCAGVAKKEKMLRYRAIAERQTALPYR